jgi:bla regulator protein BlaR1
MKAVCSATVLLTLAAAGAFAQPSAKPLTFEVASVKPSSPDARGTFIRYLPGGGLTVAGITLKTLIGFAYDVRDFQISGGPGWLGSDRFDINARPETSNAPENAPTDFANQTDEQRKTFTEQNRERLKALLADRFQLGLHRETKEQQVYALLAAKNGPKLQPTKEGKGMMRMGRGLLTGQGVEVAFLATSLSGQLGRPVIDKTGLAGKYDFELKWTPDPGQSADGPFGPLPPPPDPNGPSIFTAVQEQLGLRLESQKGPVEILVIDRAEKPSEN